MSASLRLKLQKPGEEWSLDHKCTPSISSWWQLRHERESMNVSLKLHIRTLDYFGEGNQRWEEFTMESETCQKAEWQHRKRGYNNRVSNSEVQLYSCWNSHVSIDQLSSSVEALSLQHKYSLNKGWVFQVKSLQLSSITIIHVPFLLACATGTMILMRKAFMFS